MTHARGPLFIAALASAGLLLSACGSQTGGTATPATDTTTTTATSTEETSASKEAPPVPAGGDVTAPGSKLKVGARAVIPVATGDKTGTIAITVTIEAGEKADLAKFGDKAKHLTPFYLRAKVENLSGTDLSFTSIGLRGLGEDGKGTGVIISGDTPKCDSTSAPKTFKTAGETYETCVLSAAQDGLKVAAAEYNRGDDYVKSPVVWQS
ncbi:hypothetical protein SAMN04488074_101461 [Lentzea albidocapillata subsp. violacea]|uniref:Lipoprotein n=1 Tax=Lentzea albidocapillata subsp. violacea TaxID=128104 RepID=A0A1G8QUA4_9PSEU|nr:hypothetical protein [Lentzea albidocapillata]SDJ08302.1 hypothetical protein SAMN04488074_101461 [Lentzea albidocapillata subsp. violacea]